MVEEARKKINGEVDDLKESLKEAQKLIEKYRKEVDTLEKNAANVASFDAIPFSAHDSVRSWLWDAEHN